MPPARVPSRCKHQARRGLTLIEAVLAVVLLGLVGATLASATSFLSTMQHRMEQRLGAAELGNRLMLQFMDDSESLPSKALPIAYDRDLYRWTIDERSVKFDIEVSDDAQASATGLIGSGTNLDRIKLVTIRVWLGADSGGSRSFISTVPNATLTRLVDPLAFSNPDSLQTLLDQPDGIERLVNKFIESEGSQ
ncbi:MAG: hypothetical protein JKY96_01230 [Phycisphaerales bacterium]|nr:hypothetical protein [Phycisphaerales bacterium]